MRFLATRKPTRKPKKMQRWTHQRSDFGRGRLFPTRFLSRFCSNFRAQNSTEILISKALGLCLQALPDRSSSQPCPSQTLGTIHCLSFPSPGCWLQPYLGRYSHPCPARPAIHAPALPGSLLTPQPCPGRSSRPRPPRVATHTHSCQPLHYGPRPGGMREAII